jgi:hypothetical protein
MTKGQQPVAWMYDFLNPDNRDEVIRDWVTQDYNDIAREVGFNVRPLYTGNQMNEQQLAAVKLAWELMHNQGDVGVDEWIAAEATIKQALAAPVQEPVAFVTGYHGGNCVVAPTNPARLFNAGTAFYTALPTQTAAQEPVAWRLWEAEPGQNPRWHYYDKSDFKDGVNPMDMFPQLVPLCTAAQKPWVDLPDEEIDALAELHGLDYMSYAPFVQALNAKLREKNT